MISAFRRAAEFRGEAAVTTWLHRIVVNACLDQLRRRAARPAVPADDEAALDALGQRADGPLPDPTSDTDSALDVAAALQLLPAGQRAALVLVDMFGYSVAVAADVLGVSPGTVKSRCARGRARLLPHVAHLRESGQAPGQARNQTAAGHVSPSPGMQPAPAAAPAAAARTGLPPASEADPGYTAAPADRAAAAEEGGKHRP